MNEHLYQLILEYKMTKKEALALHLAGIYIEMSRKYFPNIKHTTLPKRGDPRKGVLFKYCWKLLQETEDKLNPTEYPLYIQAQFSLLKNIENCGGIPYIDANILVGNIAWQRWYVWKKYLEEQKKMTEAPIYLVPEDLSKEIKKALDETHHLLTARLGELTKDKVLAEMPTILRWVRMNVISPFFIAMSPTCLAYLSEHKPTLGFELPEGTEAMREYYTNLFKHI